LVLLQERLSYLIDCWNGEKKKGDRNTKGINKGKSTEKNQLKF